MNFIHSHPAAGFRMVFLAAKRASKLARAASTLPRARLPPDVDPATGLCAGGCVRIAESVGKGLGAFATRVLEPDHEIGRYRGELLTLAGFHARYGDANGKLPNPEWHERWSAERRRKGISTTGQYVFRLPAQAGEDPTFMDAEDPAHANWTRFVNHSDDPNLSSRKLEGAVPGVRFVVQRHIAPNTELTFWYGPGFGRWLRRHGQAPAWPEALHDEWPRL